MPIPPMEVSSTNNLKGLLRNGRKFGGSSPLDNTYKHVFC